RGRRPRRPGPGGLQDAVPLPLREPPPQRGLTTRRCDVKPAEYRAMGDEQLELTLRDTIKNLFHLRFQSATERLETPSELRKAKREVARIKTIQRERALAAQGNAVQTQGAQ